MNRSAGLRPGAVVAPRGPAAGPEAGAPPRFIAATPRFIAAMRGSRTVAVAHEPCSREGESLPFSPEKANADSNRRLRR